MDGSVSLVRLEATGPGASPAAVDGSLLCGNSKTGPADAPVSAAQRQSARRWSTRRWSARPHEKFVVSVAWAPDGRLCASGSADRTAVLHRFDGAAPVEGDARAPGPETSGPETSGPETSGPEASGPEACDEGLREVRRFHFRDAVECVAFVRCPARPPEFPRPPELTPDGPSPAAGPSPGTDPSPPPETHLLVCCRGTNYLHYVPVASLAPWRVNMNARGDDHVSFCATQATASPARPDLLVVATDTGRVLLFRTGAPQILGELHGLPTPAGYLASECSVTRVAVDPLGAYVAAASGADPSSAVLVWCLGRRSAREVGGGVMTAAGAPAAGAPGALFGSPVARLAAHGALVRSLDFCPVAVGAGGEKDDGRGERPGPAGERAAELARGGPPPAPPARRLRRLATASFDKSVRIWGPGRAEPDDDAAPGGSTRAPSVFVE
jgi:hypothetical protein